MYSLNCGTYPQSWITFNATNPTRGDLLINSSYYLKTFTLKSPACVRMQPRFISCLLDFQQERLEVHLSDSAEGKWRPPMSYFFWTGSFPPRSFELWVSQCYLMVLVLKWKRLHILFKIKRPVYTTAANLHLNSQCKQYVYAICSFCEVRIFKL